MSANTTTSELSVVAVADKKKVKVPKVAKAKKATKLDLLIEDDGENITTSSSSASSASASASASASSSSASASASSMNPVECGGKMSEEELLIAEMEREENERRKAHAEKLLQLKLKKARRDSEAGIENLRASAVSKYEAKKVATENERKRLEAAIEPITDEVIAKADNSYSCNGGRWDEPGLVGSLDRKGFTPSKCVSELIANSCDAQSQLVIFKVNKKLTKRYINMIDIGKGMSFDKLHDMFAMFKSNNKLRKSMGVSGLGGKEALYMLSKKN